MGFREFLKNLPISSLLPATEAKTEKPGLSEQEGVDLGGPKEYALRFDLTFPAERKPKSFDPFAVHITKDFAEYEVTGRWEDATLHGLLRLNLRVAEIPRSQLGEYAAFRTDVANSLGGVTGKITSMPNSASAGAPAGAPADKSSPEAAAARSSASAAASKTPPEAATDYARALDEINRGNWTNASQDLEAVVQADPDNGNAWLQSGRARMYLLKYADAEAAFRKYMSMKPNDRLAYASLAWCLSKQQRNEEVVELLEKRVGSAPDDGDAHRRLGIAYLQLSRSEFAVKNLEKATSLLPGNGNAQFELGRAYLSTRQDSKAVEAFEKAIALRDRLSMRNDAAYELAQRKAALDTAEKWSKQAVGEVEVELNQTPLQNIGTRTTLLTASLASYWDTFGWIKYQQGNLAEAEKYLQSARELAEFSTIGYHLARVYENQGRREAAVDAYAQVLAAMPASREKSDDEKDARVRLASLLGGDSLVDARIADYRMKGKGLRTIPIRNSGVAEGFAEFILIVGPESNVLDAQSANPESPLSGMVDSLRAARMPQSFPDKSITRLPRAGMLSCHGIDQPCAFALLPVGAQSRVFSANSPSSNEP